MSQLPSPGRIVLYTVTEQDAAKINARRAAAHKTGSDHRAKFDESRPLAGEQIHSGNAVREGDVFPLIIVKVWGTSPQSSVNGQLMLDGNDSHWVTSVGVGDGPRTWAWPERV